MNNFVQSQSNQINTYFHAPLVFKKFLACLVKDINKYKERLLASSDWS
jgi:hypothetical protein